ncbi:hypothetical protein B566_EDAN018798, partial [Ephemera danica]
MLCALLVKKNALSSATTQSVLKNVENLVHHARFVNLVDCGHIIEVGSMKNWMAQNDDMVSKKSCPKCTKTISRSLRFGNDIKQSFFDICKVKRRLFGDTRTIEEKRKELETKVKVLLQESQEYDELRWFLNETSKSLGYTVDKRRNVL